MSIAHETVFPDLEGIVFPDEDHIYEIIDGEPVEKTQMGVVADLIAGELIYLIRDHAGKDLGLCFPGTAGHQIFAHRPKLVRIPDVSSLRSGGPALNRDAGYIRAVPDLIVGVISTHDRALEVEERLNDFLLAGVPLAWMVYPATRHVHVYHQGRPALRLGPADVLTGEAVLPGFSCPASEIFASL